MRPFRYVALGDSTATGYGAMDGQGYVHRLYARLARCKAFVQLENLGANGARLREIADDQVVDAIRLQPDVVTLLAGANDILQGRSLEEISFDLHLAAERLAHVPCPVLIATLPDLLASPLAPHYAAAPGRSMEALGQRFETVNAVVRSTARRYGYRCCEVYEPSRWMLRERPDFFSADGLHPSSAGYEAIAEAIWPLFASAVGAPA